MFFMIILSIIMLIGGGYIISEATSVFQETEGMVLIVGGLLGIFLSAVYNKLELVHKILKAEPMEKKKQDSTVKADTQTKQ